METQFEDLTLKEENRKIKQKKKYSGKSYKICPTCKTSHFCDKCRGQCIFSHDYLAYLKPSFKGMLNEKYYKTEVEMIELFLANPELQEEVQKPKWREEAPVEEGKEDEQNEESSSDEEDTEKSKQEKADKMSKKSNKKKLEEEEQEDEEEVDESAYKRMYDLLVKYDKMTPYAKKKVQKIHKGSGGFTYLGKSKHVHATSGFSGNVPGVQLKHAKDNYDDDTINRERKNQELNHLYVKDIKM